MEISTTCTLLALVLSTNIGCHGLRREKICQGNAKCIWLNNHLRTAEVSLFGSVCSSCKPEVFCYEGSLTTDRFQHIWDSLCITIQTTTPHNLVVSCGNSSQDVLTSASLPVSSTLWFSPFTVNCVGVRYGGSSDDVINFTLRADLRLRLMYPVLLMVGVILIFTAPSLSRNVPLIYGTGVTLGVLASVLVLLYILSRYMPGKGFLGLGFLAGGYSAVAAILYWTMGSMTDILLLYWEYVFGYAIIAGLVSFAIIYRWGGVSNPRTFDLIQWFLQLVGMILVYLSTSSLVLSLGVMVLVTLVYVLPLRWTILLPIHILKYLLCPLLQWLRLTFIPPPGIPPHRLLTQEEYEEQGRVETERALSLLKKHCEKHMDDITPLLDTSRARMKRFIQNGRHVSDEEEVNHDWTFLQDSDDDDDDDDNNRSHPSPSTSSSPSPPHPSRQPFRPVSLPKSHYHHTVS